MNFEKISFRTNDKERQLFARLNQRYKCRSITSLMHKFLQEIDDKQLFVGNSKASVMPDMSDGIDFNSYVAEVQTAKPEKPINPNRMLAAKKDINSILNELEKQLENIPIGPDQPKEESKPLDAFEWFMKELDFLARFRDAMHRSSPYIRKVQT